MHLYLDNDGAHVGVNEIEKGQHDKNWVKNVVQVAGARELNMCDNDMCMAGHLVMLHCMLINLPC